jgi:hypothetical protein
MSPPIGLKFFLKYGLSEVKDLPEKKVSQIRLALGLNFSDKQNFIKTMAGSGIPTDRLATIYDDEHHRSIELESLDNAKNLGMNRKMWNANTRCPKCQGLDLEETGINQPFSNNSQVAHCAGCHSGSTSYRKAEMKVPADGVFTRAMIAEMDLNEYSQNRSKIIEQYANGLIK